MNICVFCGASLGSKDIYSKSAYKLGKLFARRGITLIYGGSHQGLMGILADSTLNAGGKVIGVIPEKLIEMKKAHPGLTDLRVVKNLFERKGLMIELSEGFIALPGGIGTLDEITEILTWNQLGYINKPTGFLNIDGYFDKLLSFLVSCNKESFFPTKYLKQIIAETDEEVVLDKILEQCNDSSRVKNKIK